MSTGHRLIVGVSGASGTVLAEALLRELRKHGGWETHLIMTAGARVTAGYELPPERRALEALADVSYDERDIAAAPASGSFRTDGMVILPCSMKTLAGIHSGYAENLLLRAADVTLKERRPLILCPRETPLSPIHLRNLQELSAMGVAIVPPMMTFYGAERTIDDMIRHFIGKLLDQLHISCDYPRWGET